MSSDTIDRILRYGAGAEFAELYHAVGRLRKARGFVDAETRLLRVCECFDRCEDTLGDFEAEIERFKNEQTGHPEPRKENAEPAR